MCLGCAEGVFQEISPEKDVVPVAVIAIQSFGDFLGFNPHLHILSTDGCFYGKGMFRMKQDVPLRWVGCAVPKNDILNHTSYLSIVIC